MRSTFDKLRAAKTLRYISGGLCDRGREVARNDRLPGHLLTNHHLKHVTHTGLEAHMFRRWWRDRFDTFHGRSIARNLFGTFCRYQRRC